MSKDKYGRTDEERLAELRHNHEYDPGERGDDVKFLFEPLDKQQAAKGEPK